MGRGFVLSCAALLAALMLSACGVVGDDTPTYRYRMTVEVETPEGLKTGSSVIGVDTSLGRSSMNPAGTTVSQRVRGEAAAVDLPDGKVLFALLRSEDDIDYAGRIMFLLAPKGSLNGDTFLGRFANMLAMTEPIELPAIFPDVGHLKDRPARPMLVTFRDLADPTTVERVDPANLAATFGDGVSLRRITVQMTDDPVTSGIEERLEWLGKLRERGYSSEAFPDDIPLGDFSGMFKMENW